MRTTMLCLVFLIAFGAFGAFGALGVFGVFGACGGRERTNPDPDAQVPDDGSTDAPLPSASCGGLTRAACALNEYCDYADNSCGIADAPGTCKRRPDACPLIDPTPRDSASPVVGRPVCACDGRVHDSDCIAFSDGFDLNAYGCAVPSGSFTCGYAVCSLQTQYCRREIKPPAADLYTCIALPQTCPAGAPTCECLQVQPCSCSGDARAGLTLTCQ
jgi:hypothetical protein